MQVDTECLINDLISHTIKDQEGDRFTFHVSFAPYYAYSYCIWPLELFIVFKPI